MQEVAMSNIVRWNPLRELSAMQNAMDRLFEENWSPFFDTERAALGTRSLRLDIHEDDDAYTVITELPGVKVDDIHVKLDGDYLVIEGEIPEQVVEKEGARTLIQERRYGKFSRRVHLPQPVDGDKVEATYADGVLKLTLPRSETEQPKRIPVKVSGK
jgi:HSP20 family protein